MFCVFFGGGGGGGVGGHGIGGIGAVVSRVPELKNDQSLKISLKSVDNQDTTIISRVPSLLLFSLSPCLFFFFFVFVVFGFSICDPDLVLSLCSTRRPTM